MGIFSSGHFLYMTVLDVKEGSSMILGYLILVHIHLVQLGAAAPGLDAEIAAHQPVEGALA